jgi:hypothetical protein
LPTKKTIPIEQSNLVMIDYADHATVRGDLNAFTYPQILRAVGEIVEDRGDILIIRSMWNTTTGRSRTFETIVKSCIKNVSRLLS